MIVLLDSDSKIITGFKDKLKTYGIKANPKYKESLSKIIADDIMGTLKYLEVSAKEKIYLMLAGLFENINCRDLSIFSVAGEQNKTGFIRILSVPDLNIENHLVLYSSIYGMMFISRTAADKEKDYLYGDYFCAFDEIPAVIGVGTCTGNKISLINKMEETEHDRNLSEISASLAQLLFKSWQESKICKPPETEFTFQFLSKPKPSLDIYN